MDKLAATRAKKFSIKSYSVEVSACLFFATYLLLLLLQLSACCCSIERFVVSSTSITTTINTAITSISITTGHTHSQPIITHTQWPIIPSVCHVMCSALIWAPRQKILLWLLIADKLTKRAPQNWQLPFVPLFLCCPLTRQSLRFTEQWMWLDVLHVCFLLLLMLLWLLLLLLQLQVNSSV